MGINKKCIYKLIFFLSIVFAFNHSKGNIKIFAENTISVKKGDIKEAGKVHKTLYANKGLVLKVKGNKKTSAKVLKKLKNKVKKVNKYGVIFRSKKIKTKSGYTYYKVKKKFSSDYKEAILLLKKMRKYYIKNNSDVFREYIGVYNDYTIGEDLSYEKINKNYYKPYYSNYELEEKYLNEEYECYGVYFGNYMVLYVVYYPNLNIYDISGEYGHFISEFDYEKYLPTLKDLINYKYDDGVDEIVYSSHFLVNEEYIKSIQNDITIYNNIRENLSSEAIKYMDPKEKEVISDFKNYLKVRENDFSDISSALKVKVIADCFWCDSNKNDKNPFIHYRHSNSGDSGAVLFHYNDKVLHILDYSYEGNDKYFKKQKKGKVSTIFKKLRKGKFYGVCHDYTTAQRYIFSSLGLKNYYCHSKEANHAISIVKVKNSKGKSFWVYENYNHLQGANEKVSVSKAIKAKYYMPIDCTNKDKKAIAKTKFTYNDFN